MSHLHQLAKNAPSRTITEFAQSHAITLLVALTAIAALASNHVTATLEFSRSAIAEGQWWRIVTGHLTHWSADHLMWDLLMFVVLGVALESRDRARYLPLLAASALTVSAAVFWLRPEFTQYRGLSGIDSAMFVALCICMALDARRDRQAAPQHSKRLLIAALSLLLAFVGKTIHDYISGDTLMFDSAAAGFTPLALAHVAGAAAAMFCAAVRGFLPKSHSTTSAASQRTTTISQRRGSSFPQSL
jgi:rhomboid family GlyGly-CTERM serine protease